MQKMSEKEAIEELKCYRACSGTQLPTEIEAAIEALKELSQYKQGGLVLIPADVYKRQCDELDEYKAIGTVEELKELKYNGAFSGIELANIAASLAELQKYQAIGTVEECREAVESMKGEEHE